MSKLHKTWFFRIHASPEECTQTFSSVFGQKRSGLSPYRSKWSLYRDTEPTESGNVEVLVADMQSTSPMMKMTQHSGKTAEIALYVESYDQDSGQTTCQMWLREAGQVAVGRWDATANAGIIQRYMKDVAERFQELDRHLYLSIE